MNKNDWNLPKYSIVIPTFNNVDYLKQAIDSVFRQTYRDWELIVIDNNSSDGTINYLSSLKDDRVRIMQINNNGSIAKSRNLGAELARGEWIAFLDADDLWTNDKLQTISDATLDSIDFFYHQMKIIGHSNLYPNRQMIHSRQLSQPVFKDLLLHGNPIVTSSVLVRKRLFHTVGGMNESLDMRGVEDFNCWIKLSILTDRFKLLEKPLGFYRVHESNTSLTTNQIVPYVAFTEFSELLTKKEMERITIGFIYLAGRLSYLNGDYASSRNLLMQILGKAPLNQKFKCLYMLSTIAVRSVSLNARKN